MAVNSEHPSFVKIKPKWVRCRDVAAGGDAVHEAGVDYLPKLKAQRDDDYKAYNKRATFYNASWRTISGLVGMLFRKPPKLEIPDQTKPLLEDVNGAGEPFQLFAQSISEQALTTGRVGILVDSPPAPDGATIADAERLNLRPRLLTYLCESIINWKTGTVNNRNVLTMVVLKETEDVSVDEFESQSEDRWRVLDLTAAPVVAGENQPAAFQYRQRLFRLKASVKAKAGDKIAAVDFEQVGEDIYPKIDGKQMDSIPFVIMGTDDVSPDVDEPPLIDLFDMNLSHYRTTADYAHGCHFTALPTLVLTGFKKESPNDQIYLGSESAIVSSSPDARAQFVEFSGAGIGALERKLEREEQQMAILGARMLESQKAAVESADTHSIQRKGEESMLSSVAQSISLGVTQALKVFTQWSGQSPEKVKFEINRDFYPRPMDPGMLTALMSSWQSGAISDQVLFENLQQGEIISADHTLEQEQERTAARRRELADQEAGGNKGFEDPTE